MKDTCHTKITGQAYLILSFQHETFKLKKMQCTVKNMYEADLL